VAAAGISHDAAVDSAAAAGHSHAPGTAPHAH
jgi:hypothetical protein